MHLLDLLLSFWRCSDFEGIVEVVKFRDWSDFALRMIARS